MPTNRERFLEIVSVLTSYGFGHIYHTRINNDNTNQDPVNLRLAFEELGPSFVKIGQILSTRADLLPPEHIEELKKLQDRVPPFSYDHIEETFFEEFGERLEDVFSFVDSTPLASASIAQVHRAIKHDGQEVILKVQRPEVEDELLRDIHIFIRVMEFLPSSMRDIVVDPVEVFKEIEKSSEFELDFRNEAAAILKFQKLNKARTVIQTPKLDVNYISKRILVEEYIPGTTLKDKKELMRQGYDLKEIAHKIVIAFVTSAFEDGFYHGDPHPGNIIIYDGKIYFIDFGIVGNLNKRTRTQLMDLIKAIALRDLDKVMGVTLQIAKQSKPVNRSQLYEDIDIFFDTYVTRSFSEIEISTFLNDFMSVTRKHGLTVSSEFSILEKALMILEGVVSDLDPDINLLEMTKSYLQSSGTFSTLGLIQDSQIFERSLKSLLRLTDFPTKISDLVDNINGGRLSVTLKFDTLNERFNQLNRMINRIVVSLILAALIMASVTIIVNSETAAVSNLGYGFFFIVSLIALWLIISIIRSGML